MELRRRTLSQDANAVAHCGHCAMKCRCRWLAPRRQASSWLMLPASLCCVKWLASGRVLPDSAWSSAL